MITVDQTLVKVLYMCCLTSAHRVFYDFSWGGLSGAMIIVILLRRQGRPRDY